MPRRSGPENLVFRYPDGASEDKKQEIRRETFEAKGSDGVHEMFCADFEVEKEPWQEDMIKEVNEKMVKFFRDELDLEIEPFNFEDIHILDIERIKAELGLEGEALARGRYSFLHGVVINWDRSLNRLKFLNVLIHELSHRGEFKKIAEVTLSEEFGENAGKKDLAVERGGMAILKRNKYPVEFRFVAIEEGVTEITTKCILHSVVKDNPKYQKELDEKFAKLDEKISRKELFRIWGLMAYDINDVDITKSDDGLKKIYEWSQKGVYLAEQDLISFIVSKIAADKPKTYQSPYEVMSLFFRAQFRGELLPLAKEVDGVFGKGTFRLLSSIPAVYPINHIAKNALQFLKLPSEKRDPELAKKYIFGPNEDDFEKYLKKQKSKN